MSFETFNVLCGEIDAFITNLKKDNADRRSNIEHTQKKLREVDKLEEQFSEFKRELSSNSKDDINLDEVNDTENKISQARDILLRRINTMEKFDLRTAASLLPAMTGSEAVTCQLIDAIELYGTLLDEAGNKLLIQYVLKTRLNHAAKLRLNTTYNSVAQLVEDMRKFLINKKSATALSIELHSCKQNNRTIEQYGKTLEELLVNLTIAQSGDSVEASKVLHAANEKTAIATFANGLQNSEVRTVVKSRNYSTLRDAISGAKDEQKTAHDSNVFHFKPTRHFNRGNFRGNSNSNFRGHGNRQNNHHSNFGQQRGHNGRQHNTFRGRGFHNTRGHFNNSHSRQFPKYNERQKAYVAYSSENGEQAVNNIDNQNF